MLFTPTGKITLKLLALDLSLNSTGYAVIDWDTSVQKATVLELGHIDNKKQGRLKWSHGQKLTRIESIINSVIENHSIHLVVREKGVTRFNKATQVIFRVVGVTDLLIWKQLETTVNEVGITEAKKLITGNGGAEKTEVADAVQNYLKKPVEFTVDDESDAVAIGVAYCLKQGGK